MEFKVNRRTESAGWSFYKNTPGREYLSNSRLHKTIEGYSIGDFEADGLAFVRERKFAGYSSLYDMEGNRLENLIPDDKFNGAEVDNEHHDVPYTRTVYDAEEYFNWHRKTDDNIPFPNRKYRDVCGVIFDRKDVNFSRKCEVARRMALYLVSELEEGEKPMSLEDLTQPFGASKEEFYDCFSENAHVVAILQHEKSLLEQWNERIKEQSANATTSVEKRQVLEEKEKWLDRKAFVDDFVRDACDKTVSTVNNQFDEESREITF